MRVRHLLLALRTVEMDTVGMGYVKQEKHQQRVLRIVEAVAVDIVEMGFVTMEKQQRHVPLIVLPQQVIRVKMSVERLIHFVKILPAIVTTRVETLV